MHVDSVGRCRLEFWQDFLFALVRFVSWLIGWLRRDAPPMFFVWFLGYCDRFSPVGGLFFVSDMVNCLMC